MDRGEGEARGSWNGCAVTSVAERGAHRELGDKINSTVPAARRASQLGTYTESIDSSTAAPHADAQLDAHTQSAQTRTDAATAAEGGHLRGHGQMLISREVTTGHIHVRDSSVKESSPVCVSDLVCTRVAVV